MELGQCRHPRTGSIDIWAQNFLNVNRHSYVETSPGGDGCAIWGLSAEDTAELNWGFALPIDDKSVTVELRRHSQGIVAVTGLQLNTVEELANIDKGVAWALVWGDRREAAAAARKEEEASEEAEGVPLERALADVENVLLEPAPVADATPEPVVTVASPSIDVETPAAAVADKPAEARPPPPPLEITLTRLTKTDHSPEDLAGRQRQARERPLSLPAGAGFG
jgi:hypothetical protein